MTREQILESHDTDKGPLHWITKKAALSAMQAYADQQVNRVVDEALLICYKHDGIDNWLELRQKLEKLKIKQP